MSTNSASAENFRAEPDYFRYYEREVAELLSQDEIHPPELSGKTLGEYSRENRERFSTNSGSFTECAGPAMSCLIQEKLAILLRQCVKDLTPEVDKMLDPVLAMSQMQAQLRSKRAASNNEVTTGGVAEHSNSQSSKNLCSSPPISAPDSTNSGNFDQVDVLESFMEGDRPLFEEVLKKYNDELYNSLESMEQQLEKLLDSVMFRFRPMTLDERRTLKQLILKLPLRNHDRITEIITHRRAVDKNNNDELFVDIERLDDTTLWRLYFYVEAVRKAGKLAKIA